MKNIKYKYFISYVFSNKSGTGYGNCGLNRNTKIRDYNDLLEVAETIKKENNFSIITIINFKEF